MVATEGLPRVETTPIVLALAPYKYFTVSVVRKDSN